MMQVVDKVREAKKANDAVELLKNMHCHYCATLLAFYYRVDGLE